MVSLVRLQSDKGHVCFVYGAELHSHPVSGVDQSKGTGLHSKGECQLAQGLGKMVILEDFACQTSAIPFLGI